MLSGLGIVHSLVTNKTHYITATTISQATYLVYAQEGDVTQPHSQVGSVNRWSIQDVLQLTASQHHDAKFGTGYFKT